jgi:signal transduction histidine kinase
MTASEDTSFARLVSLACHDLRTPLATVHGFARTLQRGGGLGEPAGRYVDIMEEASGQLGELLDRLGLAARIESGRYDPALLDVDSVALATSAAGRLAAGQARAGGAGAAVRVDPEATEAALGALALCALRHGGVDAVELTATGTEVSIAPIAPTAGAIVLGEELRDLGAAVAVRVLRALGGTVELDGDTLRVGLPAAAGPELVSV